MNTIEKKIENLINTIKDNGLYKKERSLQSSQSSVIQVNNEKVINFCANNYLGLSNHPSIIMAAKKGLDQWGFGLSSVRFFCGAQTIHKELEKMISNFLEQEDTILYTSCFDANGGLFETLFDQDDCIISDSLKASTAFAQS